MRNVRGRLDLFAACIALRLEARKDIRGACIRANMEVDDLGLCGQFPEQGRMAKLATKLHKMYYQQNPSMGAHFMAALTFDLIHNKPEQIKVINLAIEMIDSLDNVKPEVVSERYNFLAQCVHAGRADGELLRLRKVVVDKALRTHERLPSGKKEIYVSDLKQITDRPSRLYGKSPVEKIQLVS